MDIDKQTFCYRVVFENGDKNSEVYTTELSSPKPFIKAIMELGLDPTADRYHLIKDSDVKKPYILYKRDGTHDTYSYLFFADSQLTEDLQKIIITRAQGKLNKKYGRA
jgi:hypothetical protein